MGAGLGADLAGPVIRNEWGEMSGTKPWHPSAEQLAAFGLGRLDESESAGIEGHVAGCPDCRATLE